MQGYLYIGGRQALPVSVVKNSGGNTSTVIANNTTLEDLDSGTNVWVNKQVNGSLEYDSGDYDPSTNILTLTSSSGSSMSSSASVYSSIDMVMKCKIQTIDPSLTTSYCGASICSMFFVDPDNDYEFISLSTVISVDNEQNYFIRVIKNDDLNSSVVATNNTPLYNFNENEWIWIKTTKTIDSISLSYSLDGETWVSYGSCNVGENNWIYTGLEIYGNGDINTPTGITYDLNEFKVLVDNEVFWYPEFSEYYYIHSNNACQNCFPAVTKESILQEESGQVEYLIGSGDLVPSTIKKTITRNGTYYASSDDVYGYDEVEVNINSARFGVEINAFLGTVSSWGGGYSKPSTQQDIVFTGVKSITSEKAMYHTFHASNTIRSIDFPDLTSVNAYNPLAYLATEDTKLVSLTFPKITAFRGYACAEHMAEKTKVSTAVFPALTTMGTGQYDVHQLEYAYKDCKYLETIEMDLLTNISPYGLYGCFELDPAETNLVLSTAFTNVATIGDYGLARAFAGRSNIELYFKALTSSSFGAVTTQFNDMLINADGCTVHFPSNVQAVIENWTDVQNRFSGTNTTILYDLPATE